MERCSHCGIHFAKVDAVNIIIETRVLPSGPGPELELTGRQWCSAQCRDLTKQFDQREERHP